MCRTRQQIIEETPIIQEVDQHLSENNLEPTDKMMLRLVRENHIRTIQAEELAQERDKYPSFTWLALKKPVSFFSGAGALFVASSTLLIQETRNYLLSLVGLPPIDPEGYSKAVVPLIVFLILTSIAGSNKKA